VSEDPSRKEFTKVFMANTNSSKRSRSAYNRLVCNQNGNLFSETSNRRCKNKKEKIDAMYEIQTSDEHKIDESVLQLETTNFGAKPNLKIYDPREHKKGMVHWKDKDKQVFTSMTMSREAVLEEHKNCH